METFEVLEEALKLIEREEDWCGSGIGGEHTSCAGKAICRVLDIGWFQLADQPAAKALVYAIAGRFANVVDGRIAATNDRSTHSRMVAYFQKAIRSEKAKAGIPLTEIALATTEMTPTEMVEAEV